MIEADLNHCRIVQNSLTGERSMDERTFASLAILTERLQQLKERGETFANVEFSLAVKKLKSQNKAVAVG